LATGWGYRQTLVQKGQPPGNWRRVPQEEVPALRH
jgi:hypothetical protein